MGPGTATFEYVLPGDIRGRSYDIDLWLSSAGTTCYEAAIVLYQDEGETILASTYFTATTEEAELFSERVSGADPTTVEGDVLALQVSHQSGALGTLFYHSTLEGYGTSSIVAPPIR
jgi:hypothetical protein